MTGGFVQQLRALPAESVETYQFTDSDNDVGSTKRYSSVAQAQAQARANAYPSNSGYPLPTQPSGRSTLQRTHKSPWLERLAQANQTREAESQSRPSEASKPMDRSVQGQRLSTRPADEASRDEGKDSSQMPEGTTLPKTRQRFSLSSKPQVPLQDLPVRRSQPTLELSADYTREVHVETELRDELLNAPTKRNTDQRQSSSSSIVSRSPSESRSAEATSHKVPRSYLPDQPSLKLSLDAESKKAMEQVSERVRPSNEKPSRTVTADSLRQAPRVSRVPLPRPANKSPANSVEKSTEPTLPKPLAPTSRLTESPVNQQSDSTPNRVPAISTSVAPLPGTVRISNATLKSTLSVSGDQGVRVPSQLSDATRAEQPSISDQLPSPMLSDPAALELELPNLSLPSTSSSGGDRVTLPPMPSLPELSTSPAERLRMEAPHVQVLLNGPADLPIGTPAQYEVVVRNVDGIDLNGLILRLDIPAGVQVQPLQPTHGQFEVEKAPDGLTMLTWGFENLAAGKTATAPLQLVASSAKNFAVAMEWTLMPVAGASNVAVSAPRLELALEGPAEVLFTQPNVYRLHVRNPGNAAANNVSVRLNAEPYGSSTAELALIAPGEEEVIDVELTFNKRGLIQIVAQAREQSGLSSETAIKVLVRQPILQSQIIAAEATYHGSQAECRVRLSNSGDGDATDLVARMQLPQAASLISAPSGGKLSGSELTWPVGKLEAGSSVEFLVHMSFANEGANLHQFTCSNSAGLETTAKATTQVEVISDLKLFVNDPIAPAPVGSEVVYELTLTNRGSKAATNVKVIAQFSEGIEPIRGEGQAVRVVPGQALFDPIARIGAGESKYLKVVAQAAASGIHRFRAEVRSDEAEVRLVQEESTQYLEGASRIASPPAKSSLR